MAVDIQISLLMMLVLARCLNPIRQNVLVLAMFLARMFKHAVAKCCATGFQMTIELLKPQHLGINSHDNSTQTHKHSPNGRRDNYSWYKTRG